MNDIRQKNMSAELEALLRPIASTMASIHLNEMNQPLINNGSQNNAVKEYKANCWHTYFMNGGYHMDWVHRDSEGTLICDGCGAKIYDKFDDSAKKRLFEANEVLEMMACFGPSCGFSAQMMDHVITAKKFLRRMNLYLTAMNNTVRQDQLTHDTFMNLANEYKSPEEFSSFTKFI